MNNPQCAVCGHVNRIGAASCEMCDARFADDPFRAADPFAEQPGGASDSTAWGESGWTEPGWSESEPAGAYGAGPEASATADDYIPAPPFKGVGDVLGPMLEVYRKNFVLVGVLVLVATLPVALLQYGIAQLMMSAAEDSALHGPSNTLALVASINVAVWLLSVAGSSLLSGALVYAVIDIQRTGTSSAVECLRRGLKSMPKVFLITSFYTLAVIAGSILFIIPGIIISLMYAVAVPAGVAEGHGTFAALSRSSALTNGYKGLIFLTYFLWSLLIIVLSIVITWSFAYSSALEPLPMMIVVTAATGMLNSSKDVLTVYIYLGLLRERASGFDTHAFTPGPEAAAR